MAADVKNAIRHRVQADPSTTAAEIYRGLQASPSLRDRGLPRLRTVQELVRKLKTLDTSDDWKPIDSGEDGETTRFLLDVLAELAVRTRRTTLSKETVDSLAFVRKAAPDLPPWQAYLLARAYVFRKNGSTEDLDLLLAIAPWRSEGARERFELVFADLGWLEGGGNRNEVDPGPGWSIGVETTAAPGADIHHFAHRSEAVQLFHDIHRSLDPVEKGTADG